MKSTGIALVLAAWLLIALVAVLMWLDARRNRK